MHRCTSVKPASMQVHRLCKSNLVVIFPPYCSETNVTYIRQISEHLPRDTQKSQDLYCSLFPEELTHGVLHSSPALRIVYTSGKLQWHPCCKAESRQAQRAAAKIFTMIPQNNTKKWHFLERVCRHLWVSLSRENSEIVSRFLCQLNMFGPGKGKFC